MNKTIATTRQTSNAHVLLFDQHVDEALDCPALRDGDFEGLSSAYRAICAFLVFEGVGIYGICANEHEIIVKVRC